MKPLFLLSSTALSVVACAVWAGPRDVPPEPHPVNAFEPRGQLESHQILKMPVKRPAKAEKAPPAPRGLPDVAIDSGEILIKQGASLMASQGNMIREEEFSPWTWSELDQAQAEKLLAALPQEITVPALRKRVVTLLQAKLDPPQGARDSWFFSRVQALEHIGASRQALGLAKLVPANMLDDKERVWLFSFLLRQGQVDEAIRVSPFAQDDSVSDEEWMRIQLFCLAAEGAFSEVELELALAGEKQIEIPDWFMSVLEKFQYPEQKLPSPESAEDALGKAMILAAEDKALELSKPDEPKMPPEEDRSWPPSLSDAYDMDMAAEKVVVEFPKQPSYALKAIAKLIRGKQAAETAEWLAMLDTGTNESVGSYVAHEVVRFSQDAPEIGSEAAHRIPPFSEVESASNVEKQLLIRFYELMRLNAYVLHPETTAWLEREHQTKPAGQTPKQLLALAEKGQLASYLLTLASALDGQPLGEMSNSDVIWIVKSAQQIAGRDITRDLSVEAILQLLE